MFVCVGLLRGDPLPCRDGCPGKEGPSCPSVGSESHLPAGVCPQRPRLDEGQVSHCDHLSSSEELLSQNHSATIKRKHTKDLNESTLI